MADGSASSQSSLEITVHRANEEGWPVIAEYRRRGALAVRSEGYLKLAGEPESATPETYGQILGKALFTGAVHDAFVATRADAPVRIWLSLEDPALRTWQWHWLHAPVDSGRWDFLALDQRALFSHYIPGFTDRSYPPIGRRDLRMLILAASPANEGAHGFTPFDVTTPVARLRAIFEGRLPNDVLARVPEAVGPPTLDALASQLTADAGPYSILHIVCHGWFDVSDGETWLYLEHPDGNATRCQSVSAEQLIERLARVRQLPYLILLSTCDSGAPQAEQRLGGLAQRLVRKLGTPAVIAMTEPVTIVTAQALSEAFYRRLLDQHVFGAVDSALVEAFAGLANRLDVHVPALYSRLGDQPLYSSALDREPSDREIRDGLAKLDALLAERAPVLQPQLAKYRKTLEPLLIADTASLKPEGRRERIDSLASINEICQEAVDLSFHALVACEQVPVYDARQPFRGMSPFREDDQAFFFGREELIKCLLKKLQEDPFLPVLGPSGSGKSSVVLAGLVPRLKQQDPKLQILSFSPGSEPLSRLRQAEQSPQGDGSVLYLIDQFEEVFTACRDATQRKTFIDTIMDLAAQHRVILTMRADFWGECANHPRLKAHMQARQELIAPMTTAELRAAMEQQASAVGLRFQADLSQTILDEVAGEPGAMPLLQHALLELWKRRHGRWLTTNEYRELGGVKRAIAQTADRIYAQLSSVDQERMRDIFLRLTRLGDSVSSEGEERDTRRRVAFVELLPAQSQQTDIDATKTLVKALTDAVLIVTSHNALTKHDEVEVAHEALIRHWNRLRNWLAERRERLKLRQAVTEAAAEWESQSCDENLLIHRGPRLIEVESLRGYLPLTRLEERYIDSCVAQRHREAQEQERRTEFEIRTARDQARAAQELAAREKQLRQAVEQAGVNWRWAQGITFVLLFAIVVAGILFSFWREQGQLNETSALVAESRTSLPTSPKKALELAIRAFGLSRDTISPQSIQALNNLRTTLNTVRSDAFEIGHGGINSVALSGSKNSLAIGNDDGSISICSLPVSKDSCRNVPVGNPVLSVAFTLGDQWLIAATDSRWKERVKDIAADVESWASLSIFLISMDRNAAPEPRALALPNGKLPRLFSLSPDGRWVAVLGDAESIFLWDLSTGHTGAPKTLHAGNTVTSMAFSFDGGRFAVGTRNGDTMVWRRGQDGFSGEPKERLPNQGRTIQTLAFGRAELIATGTGSVYVNPSADMLATDGFARVWSLQEATGPKMRDEFRVPGTIHQLVVSPNQRFLAVGSKFGFRLFEQRSLLKSPKLELRAFAMRGAANELADTAGVTLGESKIWLGFLPTGDELIHTDVGGRTTVVRLKELVTDGEVYARMGTLGRSREFIAHTGPVTSVIQINEQLITAGLDGFLRIWDLDGWRQRSKQYTGPIALKEKLHGGVQQIVIDPTGRWFAARSDHSLQVWKLEAGAHPVQISNRSVAQACEPFLSAFAKPQDLAFDPVGRFLVVKSLNASAVVVFRSDGALVTELGGRLLAMNKTGAILTTCDSAVNLWDFSTEAKPRPTEFKSTSNVEAAAFSDDGTRAVLVGTGGAYFLQLHQRADLAAVDTRKLYANDSVGAEIAAVDSRRILLRKKNKELGEWLIDFDNETFVPGRSFFSNAGPSLGEEETLTENWLLIGGTWPHYLITTKASAGYPYLVDLRETQPKPVILNTLTNLGSAQSFSADGEWLAIGCRDGTMNLWKLDSSTASPKALGGHNARVSDVRFSSDGGQLVSSSDDGTVRLWRTDDFSYDDQQFMKNSKVWAADSNRNWLVVGDSTGTVTIWNLSLDALKHDACTVLATFDGAPTRDKLPEFCKQQ